MKTWSFDSPDPEATREIARELGHAIGQSGLVVGLIGPLGAGKTVFVKGLAEGLGIEPAAVSSPTFVIAQQYPLPRLPEGASSRPEWLHHVDLYRLESEQELEAMGFSDLFDPGAVLAVEWADRFPGVLGPERLEIEFDGPALRADSTPGRSARVSAHGALAELALLDWKERFESRMRAGATGSDVGSRTSAGDGSEASASGGGAHAGTDPIGTNPRQRLLWMLLVAIALAGYARIETSPAAPPCDRPEARVEDALGTLRVVCREEGAIERPPSGVGGLLYGRPLDLGRVSTGQLESLPGIGPSRARAIIEERERRAFERLSDLERVHGIGPRTVERLSSWLTVSQTTRPRLETTGGRDRG